MVGTGERAKPVIGVEFFLAKRLDYAGRADGQPVYEGWAEPSSATSSALWIIKKNTFNEDGTFAHCEWADGNTLEDNVWDDRASLSYS